MPKQITTGEFVRRAREVHLDYYDYSLVDYQGMTTIVHIICPKHGTFIQKPREHIAGCGCLKCGSITARVKISQNKNRATRISSSKRSASTEQKSIIQDKKKETLLSRYGVDNPAKIEDFADKLKIAHSREVIAGKTVKDVAREKAKKTMVDRYGVDNIFKDKERIQNKFIEKYGVSNPGQVAEISERSKKSAYKKKIYTFPNGNQIIIQGYESLAIDWLISQGYHEDDIKTSRIDVPEIWYIDENGKKRRYYPDIWIKIDNQIYEVKGVYTYTASLSRNLLKREACINAGYKFTFVICNKSSIIDFK